MQVMRGEIPITTREACLVALQWIFNLLSMCTTAFVELTVQLVDFGLGSHEDFLSLFLFFSHLLSELLLSVLALGELHRKHSIVL